MKQLLRFRIWGGVLLAVVISVSVARATDGLVVMAISNNVVSLKVDGDKDDDWWIQSSTNLTSWATMTNFGLLLSGNETNAPWRSVGTADGSVYYRALQTEGLYDPTLFRTISLIYTQANATLFSNAMHLARQFGTNIYLPVLWMDNGATNYHIGARFKGNSSYGGVFGGPLRKSINLDLDLGITNADLMGFTTVNLNNANGDETVMREPIYFTVMSEYTPCPKAAMCNVYFNGAQWSVYSLVQQENSQLIREWFPSTDGDRWRAPNTAGGINFSGSNSAFIVFSNATVWAYTNYYELKSTTTNRLAAYQRLTNAIQVLHLTPPESFRERVEDVFAVDNWLWFLAIENLFVDDDSYFYKGADYGFYYEPESGRIHPVEHDGNEAFTAIGSLNASMSPVQGASSNNRPMLYRLLPNNELRQRYLAHMRTVLDERFNPATLTPLINRFHALSVNALITDPRKGISMQMYTNDLVALRMYVTNRYNFLMSHPELTPLQPDINSVSAPVNKVLATDNPTITASVTANGDSGVGSVWLYHRGKSYGRFVTVQMFDDGAHGDGNAGDGVFGANVTSYPAGTKVRYYIEARGTNAAQAARFSPARTENQTYSYRVSITAASNSPVVINEFMASNTSTIPDPQNEFDDWIELRNVTDAPVSLTGRYLSDEPNNPRKWQFPAGTTIPANSYLLVWADEDTTETVGLHASFKLSASNDEIYLTDTDANLNQVLDSITFGAQTTDVAYGRTAADADVWSTMSPTPGADNQ